VLTFEIHVFKAVLQIIAFLILLMSMDRVNYEQSLVLHHSTFQFLLNGHALKLPFVIFLIKVFLVLLSFILYYFFTYMHTNPIMLVMVL
jgi:hypothetical protein